MQAAGSSPPFIFDLDMSGAQIEQDPDFEFFDTNRAANSEGIFLPEDFPTESSQYLNFGSPNSANHKSPMPESASLIKTRVRRDPSAPSTASPAGSFRDSSSESSEYKRKSSSESSRSVITPGDFEMADDTDMGNWKVENLIGETEDFGYSSTLDPSSTEANFGSSDKAMDSMFDFTSASSSPSAFGAGHVEITTPEMRNIKIDTPSTDTPVLKKMKFHSSQNSITKSMNDLTTAGSREVSPLSAMVTSHESSPTALFHNSPSPITSVEFSNGPIFNPQFTQQGWPRFDNHGLPVQHMPNMQQMQHIPQGMNGYIPPQPMPRMAPGQIYQNMTNIKPSLTIHPIPLKSRVETQIPIKLSLFPFPPGITKLHLPTHTISKPKLLAKPTPERSPNTLELYTALVCSSAMQNPENRQRAFERAANPGVVSEATSPASIADDEPTSKALNGGDVDICPGCITRERKRAARKKIKKVEEEESWHQYEAKRVIVFNTQEIKDWQQPSPQPPTEATGDRPEPHVPYGALQVDAPMRIACYCRHQNEKIGFQVIFTIKDFQDRVIAQAMTSSIMITDDHKTHSMPTLSQQNSDGSDTPLYNGGGPEHSFPVPVAPSFRLSQSSTDLQSMQQNFNMQFQQSSIPATPSQTTSTTMTPRNLSRQNSPSASIGPIAKKRKASGSGKVPSGLAMTRLENTVQPEPLNPVSTSHSATTSPFSSNLHNFPPAPEQQFALPQTTMQNVQQPYNTGPPTPNSNNDQLFFSNTNRSQSMENLAMQQMYSAPPSAHPSRVPSPNGFRNGVPSYQQQQQQQQHQSHHVQASAQIAQSIANGFYGIPPQINPHRPPTIHKLIPNEGPRAGGIEVTCLGSGFCQGLEVMFGESKATTTTFWGETSLVCLLPPSAFSGTVAVTFKHQQQQPMPFPSIPKQQAFFKYVDDDEQQLIRTALSVLGAKMTGKMEDVGELARRIVGDGSSWGSSMQSPPTGHHGHNGFTNAATFGFEVEATVLKCLDLIDLDDSSHMPRLNLRRASGQTMLHLACSLGLNRVVAALLARGANPEPRDKGGFTPMHFAALHNHPQIVRRLMLSGADPTVRSLLGYTSSDMATSEEVLRAARRIEHHSRTRSGGSLRSRTSSATSLRSVWEPASTPSQIDNDDDDSSEEADNGEYQEDDADNDTANDGAFWMKSRRASAIKPPIEDSVDENDPVLELPNIDAARGVMAPAAAYAAFQRHVHTHFQNIQQHMHLNFPNLPQMPRFDMANLPGYQAPMVRRISNLVGNNRPDGAKEQDYKWWDLFSGNVAAPPAYEEIYPQGDVDTKRVSAAQAAADTVADNKCSELFDQVEIEIEIETEASSSKTEASSSKTVGKKPILLNKVHIGQKHTITREQLDELRLAHAEKLKRLSRDRNLFFIWIPLLVVIILAMLYNRVPQVWNGVSQLVENIRVRQINQARFVEV